MRIAIDRVVIVNGVGETRGGSGQHNHAETTALNRLLYDKNVAVAGRDGYQDLAWAYVRPGIFLAKRIRECCSARAR